MKRHRRVVGLLTDFGTRDHYVGTMKAVLHGIAPHARIVDISHEVSPQNTDEAAYLLWAAFRFFPKGTVFLCVVDPGVGTSRKILCVETKDHLFLAPDNGVLKYVLGETKPRRVISVTNKNYYLPNVSASFHGRDIFSPIAGHLVMGLRVSKLGPRVTPATRPERFVDFDPRRKGGSEGHVVHIDRFGNIITSVQARSVRSLMGKTFRFTFQRAGKARAVHIVPFHRTYGDALDNTPFMMVGSSGLIELAVKAASAATKLRVNVGDRFRIEQSHD